MRFGRIGLQRGPNPLGLSGYFSPKPAIRRVGAPQDAQPRTPSTGEIDWKAEAAQLIAELRR